MKRVIFLTIFLCFFYFISIYAASQRSYQKGAEEMLDVSYSVGNVIIINTERVLILLRAISEKELDPFNIYSHRYILENSLIDLFSTESKINKDQYMKICSTFNDYSIRKVLLETYEKYEVTDPWGIVGIAWLVAKCQK